MLLQFGVATKSHDFGGQQNLVPNLKLQNPIELVIIKLLILLCILYRSLSCSNQQLHPNNILGTSLTLNPCKNYSIYGVYQL